MWRVEWPTGGPTYCKLQVSAFRSRGPLPGIGESSKRRLDLSGSCNVPLKPLALIRRNTVVAGLPAVSLRPVDWQGGGGCTVVGRQPPNCIDPFRWVGAERVYCVPNLARVRQEDAGRYIIIFQSKIQLCVNH